MNNGFDHMRLGALIGLTARQWRRAVDRRMAALGLTQATWLPLMQLSRAAGPMRQKDLAAALGLDTSSIVRILASLTADGLILTGTDPQDRRAKAISLTERGRAVVQQAAQASQAIQDDILTGVDPQHVRVTRTVLAALVTALAQPEDKDDAP